MANPGSKSAASDPRDASPQPEPDAGRAAVRPDITPAMSAVSGGGPGSASAAHPIDGIPLPAHGFAELDALDELPARDLAEVPATEVITRAAVMLMSASAEKLGLAPEGSPNLDLDEARRLITALAGLLAASQEYLGVHRQPLRDGLRSLQHAFREASRYPDPPGEGPGEALLS